MESISFVCFCHLKTLSLPLESKILHQKNGRQYLNGDVPATISELTTAFKTVRLTILKSNRPVVQERHGRVRVA